MQNNNLPKQALLVFSGSLKTVRSRKTVICFAIMGFFILYLVSAYLLPAHRHFHKNQIQNIKPVETSCLDKYLQLKWNKLMEVNDAVVKKIPASPTGNRFFPFTGNGNIGCGMENRLLHFYLLVGDERIESYLPSLEFKIEVDHEQEEQAIVLSIKEGIISIITTYIVNKSCVLVEQLFYVHRKYMGIFHQDIEVLNKGDLPITVSFKPHPVPDNLNIKNIQKTIKEDSHQEYQTLYGEIEAKIKDQKILTSFNTVISPFQPKLSVRNKAKNKVSLTSITQFQYAVIPKINKKRRDAQKMPSVAFRKDQTQSMISQLTSLTKEGKLLDQHINSWNDIWKVHTRETQRRTKTLQDPWRRVKTIVTHLLSLTLHRAGITISSENDPTSPSPLNVNLTEYYLYSTSKYNETDIEPFYCFNGHSTVHMAKYWVVPTTLSSLYSFKHLWDDYFKLNGCNARNFTSLALSRLMVLSMIGFQYQKQHLQMALNPLNLRSNISIRHMTLDYFHSPDSLDLQVVVTQHRIDSLLIYVTCSGKHNPKIFGCASACQNVVELGTTTLKFSVHTTDPVTPLFYISTNRTHLEKIPHAPFMKVAVKTAQENHANPHNVKLSPKFWIAVVVLIVSFHVVVLKMIYNECRKNRTSGRGRGPYIS